VFRQEPTTGERVGGALGAIGGAAAVTAAESPELIPVVAPITAKAGAMAGRAVEERLLRKQSSDSNPTPLSCWVNGWDAAKRIDRLHEMVKDIETHRLPPSEELKDSLSRAVDKLINNSVNTGCKRFDTERISEFRERFQDTLRKEDWSEVQNALTDIEFALY
jgi:hypothetical protein